MNSFFLKDILADTFKRIGARIYTVSQSGLLKYGKQLKCFSVLDLRLNLAGDTWYILLAEWSD